MTLKFSPFKPGDYFYTLYGKKIWSNIPLPIPETSPLPTPDLNIIFEGIFPKKLNRSPVPGGREWIFEDNHRVLRYYDFNGHIFQYKIALDGTQIRVYLTWPIWEDAIFPLINPAMAAALTLQGYPILHASSLIFENSAFLVMGVSGSGKSSLSTALTSEGLALHSDDIATIINWRLTKDNKQEKFRAPPSPLIVAPGYPKIKVIPGLLPILNMDGIVPISISSTDRDDAEQWINAHKIKGGFFGKKAPVKAIFTLDQRHTHNASGATGNLLKVKKLKPLPAAMALTQLLYGPDWLNLPGKDTLNICTQVARVVPVFKISLPDDLNLLLPSAKKLIKDLILPLSRGSNAVPPG